ncbi:MAG: carbohydrate-binding protein [Phycisphaeraceae bacterium]|nr:carbohydrate-binding protein [Phycisphaeraceae bacterium]
MWHDVNFRKLVVALALALACLIPASARAQEKDKGLVVRYVMDAMAEGKVKDASGHGLDATVVGAPAIMEVQCEGGGKAKALRFDGIHDSLSLPADERFGGERGVTLVTVLRTEEDGTTGGEAPAHDSFFFKPNGYFLARYADKWYANVHDGKEWKAAYQPAAIAKGRWYHVALTIEPVDDRAQGFHGVVMTMYVDGKPLPALRANQVLVNTKDRLGPNIGEGWGSVHHFCGQMTELSVYDRVLSAAEILEQREGNTFLPPVKGGAMLPAKTEKALGALARKLRDGLRDEAARGRAMLFVDVLRDAGMRPHWRDQLETMIAAIDGWPVENAGAFESTAAWNRQFAQLPLFEQEQTLLAIDLTPRGGGHPVVGLYDRISGRPMLRGDRPLWQVQAQNNDNNALSTVESWRSDVRAELALQPADAATTGRLDRLAMRWTLPAPATGVVQADITVLSDGVSLSASLESNAETMSLRTLSFPQLRLSPQHVGQDFLLLPRMSGEVKASPVEGRFHHRATYPSGQLSMQFYAYYDDAAGVYFAAEDPEPLPKEVAVEGTEQGLDVQWNWSVSQPVSSPHGGRFTQPGAVTIRRFTGDWYDATRMYGQWMQAHASWRTPRPNLATPAWYRDMGVWINSCVVSTQESAGILSLRDYLEVPVGLALCNWNDKPFGVDYPAFRPAEGTPAAFAALRHAGIRVKPYLNNRIWDVKNGSGEDYVFETRGLPNTIKNLDGSYPTEKYDNAVYAILCPAAKAWQQLQIDTARRTAEIGIDALYLDQIAAGSPILCYDKTHGHDLGDPHAWMRDGYFRTLEGMRAAVTKVNPDLALDSEDMSEAYVGRLDGMLPWRAFQEDRVVPAHHVLYSGRVQYVGTYFGDEEELGSYSKFAWQLVNSQHLGWMDASVLLNPMNANLALFLKQLAHTRQAMLPIFNEGQMERPLTFSPEMPQVKRNWGYYGPRMIASDAVLSSAWRWHDLRAILFINTTRQTQTMDVKLDGNGSKLRLRRYGMREMKDEVVAAGTSAALEIEAMVPQVWLIDGVDGAPAIHDRMAQQMSGTFEQIRGFQRPPTPGFRDTLPVSAYEPITADKAIVMGGCRLNPEKTYIGWITSRAFAYFGTVNFGEQAPASAELSIAVAPGFTGGTVELHFGELSSEPAAVLTLEEATGSFTTFQTRTMPLSAEVRGNQRVFLVFRDGPGMGICNVAGLRFAPAVEQNKPSASIPAS